jgi:hypothetical protein
LLVLHLINAKEEERARPVTRLRLSEISLKRLWNRRRISQSSWRRSPSGCPVPVSRSSSRTLLMQS